MKRHIILGLVTLIFCSLNIWGNNSETLKYVVSYKWGLIHKDAGDAIITKNSKGEGFELKLVGKTKPWADKFFKVRDTLISVVDKHSFVPTHYTRIAHEKNKYGRDDISFQHKGNQTIGIGIKYRERKDGSVKTKDIHIEGPSPAYDILSIFFFLRNIDYDSLKPGETVTTTIFSGDQVEKLTVSCKGKKEVKLKDNTRQDAWHIVFKFTSEGGKKSSDDINCWISDDPSHIPLLIIGNLTIGQIRCYYVP